MSTKTGTGKHQKTGEFVKVVHERNRAAIKSAQKREATIEDASRRSTRVVDGAIRTLRASGVIR
jgi:hypothetical protein